jgi:hypothetical protein
VSGFDLLDPDRGIFASAHSGRGAVVFEGSDVLAAGAAESSLGEELRSLRFEEGVSLSLELDGAGPSARIGGRTLPEETLTLARAEGTLRSGSGEVPLACPVIEVDSPAAPPGQVTRSIAVVLADGALLAVSALAPEGAAGHGDEEISAVLAEPDDPAAERPGETRFGDALLSTEYDAERRQRRANLELWPQDDSAEAPLRGAGTVICGATLEVDDHRIDVAFFRWSIDGRPGLGRYEIVSPL